MHSKQGKRDRKRERERERERWQFSHHDGRARGQGKQRCQRVNAPYHATEAIGRVLAAAAAASSAAAAAAPSAAAVATAVGRRGKRGLTDASSVGGRAIDLRSAAVMFGRGSCACGGRSRFCRHALRVPTEVQCVTPACHPHVPVQERGGPRTSRRSE